jgi:hypothetical protein
MQGLADGYFVIPYTIGDYLARSCARSSGIQREGRGRRTKAEPGTRTRWPRGRLHGVRRTALPCDALDRKESCGGHFREESQTPDGEALRDDENFCHVSVWEFKGDREAPVKHKEELTFEYCKLQVRSYK